MNIESFLKKRHRDAQIKAFLNKVNVTVRWFFKMALTKRTLLFVTKEKIRSITLGPISQLCVFFFIAWVVNLFYQSLQYDKLISTKTQEITRLENVNSYFQDEFDNVNEKLKKVNDYLVSVTGHTELVGDRKKVFQAPENIQEKTLSKGDKHTLNKIKDANYAFIDMQAVADARIKRIEKSIAFTGLLIKKPAAVETANVQEPASQIAGQGGPLIPATADFNLSHNLQTNKFLSKMDRLIVLEKLTQVMPLARPIRSYFISSGFGTRTDPITHGYAVHQGLDFVGPNHEKIISPSQGTVVLAGQFSDYGNAVVIDHGFGITTRYGHLFSVKVAKGQKVKKGDVIALQGNTGRSTGQHLHYEIRYKNTPLNPKKFLEAGDSLFNDSNHLKHANS